MNTQSKRERPLGRQDLTRDDINAAQGTGSERVKKCNCKINNINNFYPYSMHTLASMHSSN